MVLLFLGIVLIVGVLLFYRFRSSLALFTRVNKTQENAQRFADKNTTSDQRTSGTIYECEDYEVIKEDAHKKSDQDN